MPLRNKHFLPVRFRPEASKASTSRWESATNFLLFVAPQRAAELAEPIPTQYNSLLSQRRSPPHLLLTAAPRRRFPAAARGARRRPSLTQAFKLRSRGPGVGIAVVQGVGNEQHPLHLPGEGESS